MKRILIGLFCLVLTTGLMPASPAQATVVNQPWNVPTPYHTRAPDIQWDRTFGGSNDDAVYSVQETSDGGFILTGVTYSYGAGWGDLWLIKTDPQGSKQWEKTFGTSNLDIGYDVLQTSDGGYVVTGWVNSQGWIPGVDITNTGDVWLIKTDAHGNKLWDRTFGGGSVDVGSSVRQSLDGGYIIAGGTSTYLIY